MLDLDEAMAPFSAAANDPEAYAADWKRRTGRSAFAVLPMNFPAELVHAAGALPVLIQESRKPITLGRNLLPEFNCGYTRAIADQAARHEFEVYDAFLLVDHCIQLLGAADAVRFESPDKPVHLIQFISSMHDDWTRTQTARRLGDLRHEIEKLCNAPIKANALARSISLFNRNRTLQRRLYDLRREGIAVSASQMQTVVKSGMVMDRDEHTTLLSELVASLEAQPGPQHQPIRIHLSGHLCHAPRPELLDAIEECGATVVDDDLYTGFRHIATDVPEDDEPFDALVSWYIDRNTEVPCPTRAHRNAHWDEYLLESLRTSASAGVIVLMAKFCEPHMLHYPELRKALDANDIPLLLIETEHEGIPLEALRTRVEAFIEQISRRAVAV